jgi:ferritin-like metal-binding protein YciE
MKIKTFEDLFISELHDLYNAEEQVIDALSKMKEAASSEKLKEAFEEHLEETQRQHQRLEEVFAAVGVEPKGEKCKGVEGLIKEGEKFMKNIKDSSVKDAALIAASQRVEHYEIAGYGTVRTYAQMLGYDEAARLLQETLDEEGRTDEKLNELALSSINVEALKQTQEAS